MGNSNLYRARKAKNDEFYTQYKTIEEELIHYKKHFKGKTVYCNCDDPRWSNFFKYFVDNFHELKLKRLIASCYVDQSYNLFTINDERSPAIWADYDGWLVDGGIPKVSEIEVKELKGDGDFRSEESIKLLKQADIVVTNPPFSLFREFVPMLMEYDKKFITLGTTNATIYKTVFPLIKDNKMWPGVNFHKAVGFEIPGHHDTSKSIYKDGVYIATVPAISWWTNLKHNKRSRDVRSTATYKGNEDKYPKYDNYNAINVDKAADIPVDYKGIMGVPITFIGQWNLEQFEIIGITRSWNDSSIYNGKLKTKDPILNGEDLYTRILIQNKRLNPDIYGS